MLNVNLTLVNATSKTLYPGNPMWLSSPPTSIAPGKSAIVTVIPPIGSQAFKATLSLYTESSRSGIPFKIEAVFVASLPTAVHTSAPDNFVFGHHVNTTVNDQEVIATAYPGLTVDKDAHGYAIDLTTKPMQYADTYPYVFADFVNAMFDPKVRSAAVIAQAGKAITNHWDSDDAPPVFYADFTGGQFSRIVGMFKDYWLNSGPAACPGPDQVLISTIRTFIQQQKPSLWLPVINIRSAGPPQVFNLKGYVRLGFYKSDGKTWSDSTVERFLTLIASGAHVVQVCASQDMTNIGKTYSAAADFFDYFVKAPIVRGNDLGSSHYVDGGVNNAGWYFLDVDGEMMPAKVLANPGGSAMNTGLLDAFMVSGTVVDGDGGVTQGKYNSFFQSEGWQQQGLTGGDRHMNDKGASDATAWNIGTLGASPYSEKRGTTVFLAPDGWKPEVTTVTRMMPYVGAYAKKDGDGYKPQPWLKTELVHADDPVNLNTSKYVVS
jgi:hypothetical protein